MDNNMLTLIGEVLAPANNGRTLAPVSRSTSNELAAITERLDAKLLKIREASSTLEEVYKLTSWKWLEAEALNQVILRLAPEDLTPEDMAILNHLKRHYQLSLLALSDEAQGAILRLVTRS